MKRIFVFLVAVLLLLCGCVAENAPAPVTDDGNAPTPVTDDGNAPTPVTDDGGSKENEAEDQCSPDAGGYEDLFVHNGIFYYNTKSGAYKTELGKADERVAQDGFLFGFGAEAPYIQKGNAIYEGERKLCEIKTESEQISSAVWGYAEQGASLLIYGDLFEKVPTDKGDGSYFELPCGSFYLIGDKTKETFTQYTPKEGLNGAVFGENAFYYAQGGAVYQTDLRGGETHKLCDTSENLQTLIPFDEDLFVSDGTSEAFIYRADSGAKELLPAKMPGELKVHNGIVYGSHKEKGTLVYGVAEGKEMNLSETGVYLADAENDTAYFSDSGVLYCRYDYGTKTLECKAMVNGVKRTASLLLEENPDVVNVAVGEKGGAIRTRNGTVYSLLWN